ncbi:MAG: phosphate ABC transporter permease PstA [Candidatus Nanopelagicales bacterium]
MSTAQMEPETTEGLSSDLAMNTLPRLATLYSALIGAAVAGAIVLMTSAGGVAGTVVIWYLAYMAVQTIWSFAVEGRRFAVDRLATTLIWTSFLIALAALVWILISVTIRGLSAVSWDFITGTMRNVSPLRDGGGLAHALVGTLEQVGMAALIAVPISILVAIYLVEYGTGRLSSSVTFFVDVMTGVPSIVAGLFIYTFWVLTFGFERSGFAASLALTILMIPVIVRSTEEMLKIVPNDLREAAYALGVPKWKTILRIVIPTAFGGIVTGVMLSIARVAGETAPLLLTTFLSQSMNGNLFSGAQASVPTFIWDQISSGTPASIDRAWAGALVLIIVVVLFYGLARLVARLTAPATE